jgi:hypothetical protein
MKRPLAKMINLQNVREHDQQHLKCEYSCQCPSCGECVKAGQTFCEKHEKHGCHVISPPSGSEPKYDPDVYNKDPAVRHSHNCYSYAMGVYNKKKIKECREQNKCDFDQPGRVANHVGDIRKSCPEVTGRTLGDIKKAYITSFREKCRPGFSKTFVIVDDKNDFHYVRQDKSKPGDKYKIRWSHKSGARTVKDFDAAKAPIFAPHLANWNFKKEYEGDTDLNYRNMCPYLCVPRNEPIVLAGGKHHKKTKKRRTIRKR